MIPYETKEELLRQANGTGRSNYGIKMGSGCTSYNIGYIDAGVGAAP